MRRIYVRWLFIIVPAMVPAIIWLLTKPASVQIHSTFEIIDAGARIAGLTALSLLAINIIISVRLRLFDKIFFGLDNMYRTHHLTGGWVVIFLLFHSGLLTLKYSMISLMSGYEFLKPSLNIPLTVGKLALFMLVSIVVLAMYFKIRYEWFVISMRLLGAVIFLGGYHALFVSGTDLRTTIPLLVYMLTLGGIAAGLYIYRSVFRRVLHRPYPYVVDEIIRHSSITEVWLRPVGDAMQRFAGQFSFVRFEGSAVEAEEHPFTISSGSNDPRIRFCVRNVGDFTSTTHKLQHGDKATLEGPYGNFSFTKAHRLHQVWIGGGIGITPFLAMARSLDGTLQHHITLYYIIRTNADAVYLNELETISKQMPSFKVLPIFTQLQGRPEADDFLKGIRPSHTDFMLCGPPSMLKTVRKQLIAAGVPRTSIYSEEFVLT